MDTDIDEDCMYNAGPSEGAMQAAGRLPSHTYADLRSARRAYQRTRKYRPSPERRLRCSCCLAPYYKTRLAQRSDIHNTLKQQVWHDDFAAEERWNAEYNAMDEVVKFATFGRWRDGVQDAEDFGTWGRRRIDEMRACKEQRLRCAQKGEDVTSLAPTTTLPTSHMDMHAHTILRSMLTPSKRDLSYWHSKNQAPLHTIWGFGWFGEYAWAWHRNASGCWEFGYDGCEGDAFPCPCCCSGNGSMYYACLCEDFKDGEGQWVGPAPEEAQRCSLVEWVSGSLRGLLQEDDNNNNNNVSDEEQWEMLSNATSQDWSVLSQASDFDAI
jgi:hypothetical protein